MSIGIGIGTTNAPKQVRTSYLFVLGAVTFVLSMFMWYVASGIVLATAKTVTVCFAECPVSNLKKNVIEDMLCRLHTCYMQEGLRLTHPNSFATLIRGYVSSYPEVRHFFNWFLYILLFEDPAVNEFRKWKLAGILRNIEVIFIPKTNKPPDPVPFKIL